ncbi:hypothetical protein RIF29_18305 [Crotalaria pallida]|uniref:Uncharacterized protein n=1 Tax=Crotalaria pallida TaxID=3830 RepID=A0AAN9FIT9_CROPI
MDLMCDMCFLTVEFDLCHLRYVLPVQNIIRRFLSSFFLDYMRGEEHFRLLWNSSAAPVKATAICWRVLIDEISSKLNLVQSGIAMDVEHIAMVKKYIWFCSACTSFTATSTFSVSSKQCFS